MARPPKTAFVMAGGGSLGAVQVGQLQALHWSGVSADLVVGSSVGAFNAAHFSSFPDADGLRRLELAWRNLKRSDVFPVDWRTVFRIVWRGEPNIATTGLRRLLDTHLPGGTFERARVPLHVVATNVLTGDAVVISHGSVADAVIASSAIPAVFAPVAFEGRILADGAVASNTPLKIACDLGAERAFVLPTGFACAAIAPPRGAIANALNAIALLTSRQLLADFEIVRSRMDVHILPTMCPLTTPPHDFSQSASLIDGARQLTHAWIAAGGLDSDAVPDQLRAHSHA
jgi:NTE family protein